MPSAREPVRTICGNKLYALGVYSIVLVLETTGDLTGNWQLQTKLLSSNPTHALMTCVTVGMFLNFSGPVFFHLENGDPEISYLLRPLPGFTEAPRGWVTCVYVAAEIRSSLTDSHFWALYHGQQQELAA